MFAILPILLMLGMWTGLVLLALIPGSAFGEASESFVNGIPGQFICYGSIWLPAALTALLFCRAARHRPLNWPWSPLPAATLAVFPGMTVGMSPSTLSIGLLPAKNAAAFIQFMPPLAIGGWYSWREYRLQRA
jgi:hypothetical protein